MKDLTAILLCGGKGERLGPAADVPPKVLVPLGGRPLLLHLLNYLSSRAVERFVVCVGHRAAEVERFVAENRRSSWTVECVDSGADATIADRLLDARERVAGRALVCYGDTLANVDLRRLARGHDARGALATMTVYPLHSPFGVVRFDSSNRVTAFAEKPVLPHWINIGFMLCERRAFDHLRPGGDVPEFFADLARAGALYAHVHDGKHLTVNTEKDRLAAETEFVEFFTLQDEHPL